MTNDKDWDPSVLDNIVDDGTCTWMDKIPDMPDQKPDTENPSDEYGEYKKSTPGGIISDDAVIPAVETVVDKDMEYSVNYTYYCDCYHPDAEDFFPPQNPAYQCNINDDFSTDTDR